ncbi:MAG: magnesium and cobalt exporter, family, partial [Actinomycetota bacterium]|nr:magnesium and cobalt exporter, family [Actinomycetota bacterium]
MSTVGTGLASLGLLAANAFFVAAEFSLVAAKPHRLEQSAAAGSRSARAALRASRRLSLTLAGAQLGITVCTLGLGALAEPAVVNLLEPVLSAVGLPAGAVHPVAFTLAVGLVGFAHVVVGEMAPKSWAISRPEFSAQLLAWPFGWFTSVSRPVLAVLNALANGCLRLMGVRPQDELAGAHGPQELGILIESSRERGTLEAPEHQLLTAMLAIQRTTVGQVMVPAERIVTISSRAGAREVERVCRSSGRSRLVVLGSRVGPIPGQVLGSGQVPGRGSGSSAGGGVWMEGAGGRRAVVGVVHVREAARVTTAGIECGAEDLSGQVMVLSSDTRVAAGVRLMRAGRAQVALVGGDGGAVVGLVALEDLLEQLIGEFDDETDPVPSAVRGRR